MAANGLGEAGSIELGRAEIITTLTAGFTVAFGLCLDHSDHGKTWERHLTRVTPVREQPGHVVAYRMAAGLDPAMLAVGGLAGVESARRWVGPVRLQRQKIVAVMLQDGSGKIG